MTAEEIVNEFTARITKLDFHPLGLSLELRDTIVTQDEHPDPPIARIPLLKASVYWRALLHGRAVGDFLLDRPTVHLNLTQARKEIADPTPVKERGWQDALEAIYPLKINQFRVKNGELTYIDQGFKPLRVRSLNIVASNIRNVASAEQVYPSPVRVDGAVFEKGSKLRAPVSSWRSIARKPQDQSRGLSIPPLRGEIVPQHRRPRSRAAARAARLATSTMCASSTPNRYVDHDPME